MKFPQSVGSGAVRLSVLAAGDSTQDFFVTESTIGTLWVKDLPCAKAGKETSPRIPGWFGLQGTLETM